MVNEYLFKPFNVHIKTAEQRTIIHQYSDWYTGRWWVGCYILYSEKETGRGPCPPRPLLVVQNVTAHPSTASAPTSYHSTWHCNCLCTLKGFLNKVTVPIHGIYYSYTGMKVCPGHCVTHLGGVRPRVPPGYSRMYRGQYTG